MSAYLSADPRSLALGRIVLALVLWLDWCKRASELVALYSNQGLMPNFLALQSPPYRWTLSWFLSLSWPGESAVALALCALAYLALLLGWHTRIAQIASVCCVLNLHGRTLYFQNGGDVVLGQLCLWTAFLPTGERFSLDALRKRAASPSRQAAEGSSPPIVSLAFCALVLHIALIYGLNAFSKTGATWREGSSVHYVLHQDRIVTALGLLAREHLPPGVTQWLTWSAQAIEFALPVLVLSPVLVRGCRRAVVLLMIALHAGFGLFMNLGVFVPAMIAYTPNLIPAADWDAVARWLRAHPEGLAARLCARLHLLAERLAARTLHFTQRISGAGTSTGALDTGAVERPRSRAWSVMRELGVGLLLLLMTSQALQENFQITKFAGLDLHPRPARIAITYLQFWQGWSMFAPDAPPGDANMFVEAVTRDGRRVDPWSEFATPRHPHPGARIPDRLGYSAFMCNYAARLPWDPRYHTAFIDWVLRYPRRTGNPQDEIVSFEAFVVEDESPPPGETRSRNNRVWRFLNYP